MKKIWIVMCLMLAACGGGGTSSDGQTSPDLTAEEQVAAAEMIMSEQGISDGVESALLGGAAAMVTDAVKSQKTLKDDGTPVTVDCAMGGTLTITATGSGTARVYTATFDNCAAVMTTPSGVGITFSITGAIEISGTTVTYGAGAGDIVVLWACITGGSAFHTCHMSGTTTGSGESVSYNLNGYCGSTNFTHTGSLTGTLRAADNHFIISGTATYVVTGTSSGRIVHCSYSDFDVTTATCAEYATACGLNPTIACSTECPD